jgi:hypothetical protein
VSGGVSTSGRWVAERWAVALGSRTSGGTCWGSMGRKRRGMSDESGRACGFR